MKFFDLVKYRRSIRKYQDRQISQEDLKKIMEVGLYAPNAGGGQRTIIVAVHNKDLCEKIGFYGAPAICAIFAPKNFLYSIPDAFCCAENMVLAATELGLASCIIARGEETFDNEPGAEFLKEWNIPDSYIARCFVLLGYCEGEYPQSKPRKEGRSLIVE